jgi:regulatory protein
MADDDDVHSDTPTPRMLNWARNSTLYRLGQRMMTEKQLSGAIAKKARQKFEGIADAQVEAVAAAAVKFAYEVGGLNDVAFAEVSARAGVRNGRSKRIIAQKLSAKGIDRGTVAATLEDTDDLQAAVIFVRKRALGPFRRDGAAEDRKAKELATLARNGFSFGLAKTVLSMSREEAEMLLVELRS